VDLICNLDPEDQLLWFVVGQAEIGGCIRG
jgi:hypothetical protein